MSHETATLHQELKRETKELSEQNSQLRSRRNSRGVDAARKGSMQGTSAGSPRGFGERLKTMLSNLAKAMEGDQESHKFRS